MTDKYSVTDITVNDMWDRESHVTLSVTFVNVSY